MIIETLLNIFLAPVMWLLSLLPTVDYDVLQNWEYIKEILVAIFGGVGCILPMEEFIPLAAFQSSLWAFKLVYALVLRIKSFLPLWGGT